MKNEEKNKSYYVNPDMRLSIGRNVVVGADLFLRPLFGDDSKYLYNIYTNSSVMDNVGSGGTRTRPQVDGDTKRRAAYPENGKMKIYYWVFFTSFGAEGAVALTYHKNRDSLKITEEKSPEKKSQVGDLVERYKKEILILRSPEFSGRLVASKVITMLADFVGGDFFATISPKNTKSKNMSKNIGMKKCEDLGAVAMYGKTREFYTYSTGKKEKKSLFIS